MEKITIVIIRQLCLEKLFFWLWHRSIDADVKFENVRVRFLFLIVRVIMNRFIVLWKCFCFLERWHWSLLNRTCEAQMRFEDVRLRILNIMAQKQKSLSIREFETVMSFASQALDDISSRCILYSRFKIQKILND